MGQLPDDVNTLPLKFAEVAGALLAEYYHPDNVTKQQVASRNASLEQLKDASELGWKLIALYPKLAASFILKFMNAGEAEFDDLAKIGIDGLFGEGGAQHGHSKELSRTASARLLEIFAPSAESIQPGDEAAKTYLDAVTHLAVEGWLQGWIFELVGGMCPESESLEKFGELKDIIAKVMGIGRLTRRVLNPFITATVVTPATWKMNKQYRPELHSPAQVASEWASGNMSLDAAREELARQGWSDARQDAFFRDARKRLTLAEMMSLRRFGAMSDDTIMAVLKQSGYDDVTAAQVVSAQTDAALESVERSAIGAIQRAYINRNISLPEMQRQISAIVSDRVEAAYYMTAATAERDVNVHGLSAAEAKACVKRGILAMSDYRAVLARDGYEDTAIFQLELLLRAELNEDATTAAHAQAQVVERATEKAARDAAAKARKAQIDAERALHRRGSLATLERAVVRGLIPVARYAEVLNAEYDADTVQIMVDLLEQARTDYLDQQARAADARKRAGVRNIDVGALEQAVLGGVLTLNEFRGRLGQLGFPGGDADLLTDTLGARLADAAAAATRRAAAEAAAKVKSIDLGRFERLVVRGVRTMDQYVALLADLGFDEGSRADMADLLRLQIADAAAAAEQRRLAAEKANVHDVTLDQMRRAVVLGLSSEAAFQTYLVSHGFTTDAQALLLAELRADVADVDAARQRRAAAEAATQVRVLPLSTLARAARLGLVPLDVYERRLVKDGYTNDDRAIELLLLSFERDEVAAARAKRDAQPAPPDARGLTLAETDRAVKAGALTLDDYRARAVALNYDADAVDTLVQVLRQELLVIEAAKKIHDTPPPTPTRDLSVAQYEAAVKAGAMTVAEFTANVRALGYEEDAAALLTFLLETKLQGPTGG